MEFRVNNKEFLESLSVGGSMAGKSKTAPILDNAKLTIKGQSIAIVSYDLECAVSKRTNILSSSEDFSFCINPRDLMGILKTIKDDEVSFRVEGDSCFISHSKGEVVLPTFPSEDFPSPKKEDNTKSVEIDSNTLCEWLSQAQRFVGVDKMRPILNGVFIYIAEGEIGVASSDSHKMYHNFEQGAMDTSFNASAIIPTKPIGVLCNIGASSEKITVAFGEQSVSFRVNDASILCRLIVGAYPRFKQIIPTNTPTKVSLDKEDLENSVSRSLLTASLVTSHLKLGVSDNSTLTIESEDTGFRKKSNEVVNLHSIEGSPIEIGVRGSFLIDCLSIIESSSISLGFTDPKKPILFMDEENPNKKIILMPSAMVR